MNYLCGKNNPKRFHCAHKNQAHMFIAHVHKLATHGHKLVTHVHALIW